jgi:large subunit ribosomal protein L35
MKTHSGAKKRLRMKSSGVVKRKQTRRRHILSNKSSKRKRLLGAPAYVDDANMYQIERCLVNG